MTKSHTRSDVSKVISRKNSPLISKCQAYLDKRKSFNFRLKTFSTLICFSSFGSEFQSLVAVQEKEKGASDNSLDMQ